MFVKSLGYRMDLSFPGFKGEVIDRGDYLVIRTPDNPSYYWGNYLLFDAPPTPSDFDRWRDLFYKEIGKQPNITHEAFGWDSPSGEMGHIEPFLEAGYNLNNCSVLTTSRVGLPPYFNPDVVVRPVETDEEWEMAGICASCYATRVTAVNDRIRKHMIAWRAVSLCDAGKWYGAFLKGVLVGGLGIYTVDETGVIDNVVTHPDFREKGVGRSLVYLASLHAIETLGVKKLLLSTDNGSAAKRMYEQVGFRTVEQQLGIDTA